VQATLKQRDEEVSRLNGELTQLSLSHEDLHQSLEEQEAMVLSLRQAAEDTRKTLEAEKKQVEGESLFCLSFACRFDLFGIRSQLLFSFMVFRLADRPGELDDPGSGCPDGLQLLSTGVGGAAGHRPRGMPGG
jgi:hypothetical protein